MASSVVSRSEHPLVAALRGAVDGVFPPADSLVEVVAPDGAGTHAVVEFTAHSFVLTDRSPDDRIFDGVDAYGGATHPGVLADLAGRDGWIGSLDLVMVRRAGAPAADALPPADRYDGHARVDRARAHRRDVRVLGDDRGLVCVGVGLVGRTEMSVEVMSPGRGAGRGLVLGALVDLPDDEVVYAQVAPGNAASVRMFLACGFVPIGSEVLIEPHRP
jgi:hypothetical protein